MEPALSREGLYRQRMRAAEGRMATWANLGSRIGHLRGLSFLTFVVCGGIFVADGTLAFLAVSLLALLAFFLLIRRHDVVLRREENETRHALLNAHALARVTASWQTLPQGRHAPELEGHPYAADLDLFGSGSLYQRISVAHTRYGKAQLTQWLLEPASVSEIALRQGAALELSTMLDFRQDFEAEGLALGQRKSQSGQLEVGDGPDPAPLLTWVRSGIPLPGGLALLALSFVVPVLTVAGMVATFHFGQHPICWLLPFLFGLVLLRVARKASSETFAAVSTTEGAFLRYGGMLACLERLEATSPWIRARSAELLGQGASAQTNVPKERPSAVMARFRSLVGWYDLRHNGMAYPFINALLLWDIHCTRALQGWRTGAAADIERWFSIIGECEALSSLAGLLHDDAHASLPVVTQGDSSAGLAAESLGHPLIACEKRVENPLPNFARGEALLITGSNMSGKSTFLRSLGINVVLALAGGPVIAKGFVLPWCKLSTSIRISDSLASGVSHFYAEISKLKATLDQADGAIPLVFLLDEILHGTNSRERQIGARWVLAELLERGALGIVTTHDMELCRLTPPLMERVQQFHFREDVRDEPQRDVADGPAKMTFDYTLRPGPVASGNALRLMRSAGLPVPLSAEGPPESARPAGS